MCKDDIAVEEWKELRDGEKTPTLKDRPRERDLEKTEETGDQKIHDGIFKIVSTFSKYKFNDS